MGLHKAVPIQPAAYIAFRVEISPRIETLMANENLRGSRLFAEKFEILQLPPPDLRLESFFEKEPRRSQFTITKMLTD